MTPSIPLAWLGTYLVHSTLLLGLAWAASRLLRRRPTEGSLALEESLWKVALVGGILTATLQVGLGIMAPAPAATSAALPAVSAPAELATPAATGALAATTTPHPILDRPAGLLPGWQRLALGIWLLGAVAGLGLLAASWVRLRRALRPRHDVHEGPSRKLLDRLMAACRIRRPVRLTGAEHLPVPVALGVLGREICVPRRALEGFGPRRQEALLAHELAHLERHDPAWLLAGSVIGSTLFFQPLNRVARHRLEEIAEYRCDAWAVERTGDRVGLARCLTEVAGWLTGREPATAPGMASGRTALGRRVQRILDGSGQLGGETARRWSYPLSAALLIAVGCIAPGVAPALPAPPAAEPSPAPIQEEIPSPEQAPEPSPAQPSAPAEAAPAAEPTAPAESPEAPSPPPEDDEWVLRGSHHPDLSPELRAEIAEIERLAAEIARRAVPDPEALEELSAEAARIADRAALIDGEAMAALRAKVAEIAPHRMEEMSPEERERLEAEIERLAAEVELEAERLRPTEAELERLEAMAERMRPAEEELERMEQELQRRARELERRVHEEHRRTLEARRHELEERQRELRQRVGEMEGREREQMEERRHELEEAHRALEEAQRELEDEELERRKERTERERSEAEGEEPPRR